MQIFNGSKALCKLNWWEQVQWANSCENETDRPTHRDTRHTVHRQRSGDSGLLQSALGTGDGQVASRIAHTHPLIDKPTMASTKLSTNSFSSNSLLFLLILLLYESEWQLCMSIESLPLLLLLFCFAFVFGWMDCLFVCFFSVYLVLLFNLLC